MSRSLLFLAKRTSRLLSLLPTNPFNLQSLSSIHSHGHSPPSICSAQCQGRLRRQRGIPNPQQVWRLNGSSLPLSGIHHSHPNRCLHRSHRQVSPALPPSLSLRLLSPLQEKMLASDFRDSWSEIPELPTKSVARSIASYANSHVSSDEFSILLLPTKLESPYPLCMSSWHFSRSDLGKKMRPLKFGTQLRVFSSCDFEEERENEDGFEVEDAEENNNGSEVPHKSIADPEEVRRVAKRFKHARKPAFRFFCWAGQRPGFSHDSRTYNAMLMILGKTRQLETMGSLLEETGDRGLLTMESFTIAIKAYASGKERKKAVDVFELMKKYGFKAGVETSNCLLDALAREKFAKEAQALYDKLKSRFTPNMKTYAVLLSGWCGVKNLTEAGRIWNEMTDQGLKPDIITLNIMPNGLLKVKKRSDAIKLFEVMKAKGPAPNVRSYTILIRDLCKHCRVTEAVSYFDEMLASGCEPDAVVYTYLITGFGNEKKMDMVFSLLKEMKDKGYPPDGRLCNALIKLMTNRRMPDDALRIYKKMIQGGIQPTIHTYNMMMKSDFLVRNSEMGCAVWDEMVQRGCCPDENSYFVLIGGLIRHGRSDEACKYIEEMINKGMRVPQIDFGKFVADFTRIGRPNILAELAQKTRLSGKSEVPEVLARWAETTQKRMPRRNIVDSDV